VKNKLHISVVLAGLFLVGCQERTPQEIQDLSPKAEFIFIGTIQLINSTTLTIATEEVDGLSVVMIDKIMRAPNIFQNLEKTQVTVKLMNATTHQDGQSKLFFTNGWLFENENYGVVEVGNYFPKDGKLNFEKLQSQVNTVLQNNQDDRLKDRLQQASLVVAGKVTAVSKDENTIPMITEHDPDAS